MNNSFFFETIIALFSKMDARNTKSYSQNLFYNIEFHRTYFAA